MLIVSRKVNVPRLGNNEDSKALKLHQFFVLNVHYQMNGKTERFREPGTVFCDIGDLLSEVYSDFFTNTNSCYNQYQWLSMYSIHTQRTSDHQTHLHSMWTTPLRQNTG